jgi:hypothetical protein
MPIVSKSAMGNYECETQPPIRSSRKEPTFITGGFSGRVSAHLDSGRSIKDDNFGARTALVYEQPRVADI